MSFDTEACGARIRELRKGNKLTQEKLGMTTVMMTIIVPMYNILAVTTLEIFRGGKVSPGHIIKEIFKNPLIMGAIAGILAVTTQLKVPYLVENTVDKSQNIQLSLVEIPEEIKTAFEYDGKAWHANERAIKMEKYK